MQRKNLNTNTVGLFFSCYRAMEINRVDVSAKLVERNAIQSVETVTDKLPVMLMYLLYVY